MIWGPRESGAQRSEHGFVGRGEWSRNRGESEFAMLEPCGVPLDEGEWRNWQTRWLQESVGATPWRFESSFAHHLANRVTMFEPNETI